jgi:hypothetical protein
MRIQAFIRKESRDGMIRGLKRKSSRKEIRSSSIIQDLKLLEEENCKANGTVLMMFIWCYPME